MKVLFVIVALIPYLSCEGGLLGGQTPYNTNLSDPNVAFAVKYLNEYFMAKGDARPRTAVQIVSATSQLVSGINYRFQLKISGGDANEICNITIWRHVGVDQALSVNQEPVCVKDTASQSLLGGQTAANLLDPDVQSALAYFEQGINKKSNNFYYLKATGSGTVTKQVVNGVIFRFTDIDFAPSTCTKNNLEKLCPIAPSTSPLLQCSGEVYWNPRETPQYQLSNDSCKNSQL